MVPMTNVTDVEKTVRRGPKFYQAAPGDTVDVYPVDVPFMRTAGFEPAEENSGEGTPDESPVDVEDNLDAMTVDELRDLARERDVSGRSTMSKADLVSALTTNTEE